MAVEKSAFGIATRSSTLRDWLDDGFKFWFPPRTNRFAKHCALFSTRGRKSADTAIGFATVGDFGAVPTLLGGF